MTAAGELGWSFKTKEKVNRTCVLEGRTILVFILRLKKKKDVCMEARMLCVRSWFSPTLGVSRTKFRFSYLAAGVVAN